MAVSEITNAVAWELGQEYDTGSFTSVALDNQGNCVETHVGSDRLFYRIGKLNAENQTIQWVDSQEYDTGSFTSVALDNQGNCVETHVGSDRLFYRIGKLNAENQTIQWADSQEYDTGSFTSVALDNQGNCVETHVGSDRLFYRIGKLNAENQTIRWGDSQEYDTGSCTSVALDNQGNCVETHVGSYRLFYRIGKLNAENQTIQWGDSQEYDTGSFTSVALDNQGNCVETHVGSDRLFYRIGKLNAENQTIQWGDSQEYGSGATSSITLDDQGNYIRTYREGDRLHYRFANLANIFEPRQEIVTPPVKVDPLSNLQPVLAFDGEDDYIEIPHTEAFNFAKDQDFAIELWLKPDIEQQGQSKAAFDTNIIEKWAGKPFPYTIRYSSKNGRIYVSRYDSRQNPALTSAESISDQKFHHIAFVKETSRLSLYIDGVEVTNKYDTTTGKTQNDSPLYLSRGAGGRNFFKGQISELRIWDTARSSEEIRTYMTARLTGNEAGLVGYWPLNDGVGNTVQDYTSNSNHGTIYGSPTWVQTELLITPIHPIENISTEKKTVKSSVYPTNKKVKQESNPDMMIIDNEPHQTPELKQLNQQKLVFDGKDIYINLGKKSEFKIAQQISLEAWINCQVQRRRTGIITNVFDTNQIESGYGLLLDGKSGIFFALKTPSKSIQYLSSKENSIKLNHWHHIAGTYDGKRMKVYVDGVEKASKSLVDESIDYEPENDLVIGIYQDNNEIYPFKGQIKEVRLWNKVRSPEEIQADMAKSLVGNETGLVGYWPLNDGLGTIVEDKTIHANHGNIIGNTAWVQTEIPIETQQLPETQLEVIETIQQKTQTPMSETTPVITPEKSTSTKTKQQKAKNTVNKYPYKILSIDGGGIRGIIPAMILAEIERRTEKPISSLFDLIAGTSTGGMLALGLVKPHLKDAQAPAYTAQQLVSIFYEHGNVIFYEPLYAELLGDLDEIIKPKYSSEGKNDILTDYFGNATIKDAITEVLITSYDIEQRMPVLFTSNVNQENVTSRKLRKICTGFTMKEAAMATSAAPTYFPPYRIATSHNENGFYTLVDGGVVANNPTALALVESITSAKAATKRGEDTWTLDNTLVVSLGTGSLTKKYPYQEAKNWGLVGWARPMLNIVLDGASEAISCQIEQLLPVGEDLSQQQYYRFQTYIDEMLEAMDNAKFHNISMLVQVGKQMIEERTEEIDSLCDKLAN